MLTKDMTRLEVRLDPALARVLKIALARFGRSRQTWFIKQVTRLCKEYAPDDLKKIK